MLAVRGALWAAALLSLCVVAPPSAGAAKASALVSAPGASFIGTLQREVSPSELIVNVEPTSPSWRFAGWVMMERATGRVVAGGIRVRALEFAAQNIPLVNYQTDKLPKGDYDFHVFGEVPARVTARDVKLRSRTDTPLTATVDYISVDGPNDAFETSPREISTRSHLVLIMGAYAEGARMISGRGCVVSQPVTALCAPARSDGAQYSPLGGGYVTTSNPSTPVITRASSAYPPGEFAATSVSTKHSCTGTDVTAMICVALLVAVEPAA